MLDEKCSTIPLHMVVLLTAWHKNNQAGTSAIWSNTTKFALVTAYVLLVINSAAAKKHTPQNSNILDIKRPTNDISLALPNTTHQRPS
jgi:hypothetical protein